MPIFRRFALPSQSVCRRHARVCRCQIPACVSATPPHTLRTGPARCGFRPAGEEGLNCKQPLGAVYNLNLSPCKAMPVGAVRTKSVTARTIIIGHNTMILRVGLVKACLPFSHKHAQSNAVAWLAWFVGCVPQARTRLPMSNSRVRVGHAATHPTHGTRPLRASPCEGGRPKL